MRSVLTGQSPITLEQKITPRGKSSYCKSRNLKPVVTGQVPTTLEYHLRRKNHNTVTQVTFIIIPHPLLSSPTKVSAVSWCILTYLGDVLGVSPWT